MTVPPAGTGTPVEPEASADGDAPVTATAAPASDGVGVWHLVDVRDVAMTLPSTYPEVVLQEREAPFRVLRVPVALADGTAIAYAWRGVATARPLTHELFVDVLGRHQVVIEAVRVTAVEEGTFHAELDTTGRTGRQVVPCRTSDALALALRQRPTAPILVAEWVLAEEAAPAT
jgi:bifunctional DNase/RNase